LYIKEGLHVSHLFFKPIGIRPKSANIGHTLNLKTSNEAPIGPLLPLMKWVVSIWSLKE